MWYVSALHSVSYSIIAIQEMNLAYFYPTIFWNTARLLVASDTIENLELSFLEDEEDITQTETNTVKYFKLANAIGEIRKHGVAIEPPHINKSGFVFMPVVAENKIYFGLSGIAGIGAKLVEEILAKRPFNSPQELLANTALNRLQVINLIKAGAFDDLFENREKLLDDFCYHIADIKSDLNMRNMAMLVSNNLLPSQFEAQVTLWKLKTFLSKHCTFGDLYVPSADTLDFLSAYDIEPQLSDSGELFYVKKVFDAFTTKYLAPVKAYIQANKSLLLEQVNELATQVMKDKYYQTREEGELFALSHYPNNTVFQISAYADFIDKLKCKSFHELPPEPVVEWEGENGGKKFELSRIAVSCVGRDKAKRIVGAIDSSNLFFQAKINKNMFAKFDRQITTDVGRFPSWFSKGSHLLLTGYRDGDSFIVKSYKGSTPAVAKITGSGETLGLVYDRED